MTLSGSDKLPAAITQYRNSLRWRFQTSIGMAEDFIEAVLFILEAKPTRDQLADSGMSHDLGVLERQLEAATSWRDTHPDATGQGQGITYADLSGART